MTPAPIRGYHLLSEKNAISDLEFRRLKVSRLSEVNDPFELAALNCMNKKRRAALKKFKEAQNNKIGMLCFCEYWQDPMMWSHYADNHRGVCLGFDLDPALGVGGLQKVNYVEAKLELEGDLDDTGTLPPDVRAQLLVTKFKNWAHEKERRSFLELSSLSQENGHFFVPLSAQVLLKEVILGPQCPGASLAPIKTLAKGIARDVKVSRARLGFKKFEVRPDGRYPAM